MGRATTLLLGLMCSSCAFDTSGVPTASDGTGLASSSESGTTTTTTSTTTSTTAVSASASAEGSVDTSTADDASSTSGIDPTVSETDPSTSGSGSVDPSLGTSSGDESSGGPEPICGNGMIESPETCETGDLGTFVCSDLGAGYSGTATCGGCQIDDGPCCVQTGEFCVPGLHDCCGGCGGDFECD